MNLSTEIFRFFGLFGVMKKFVCSFLSGLLYTLLERNLPLKINGCNMNFLFGARPICRCEVLVSWNVNVPFVGMVC